MTAHTTPPTTETAAPPVPATASTTRATASPTDDDRRAARWGRIGALTSAACYLVGFGVIGAYLAPEGYLDSLEDPVEAIDFVADHHVALYAWNAVIFVLAGLALVPLTLALRDRIGRRDAPLGRWSGVAGSMWAGLVVAAGLVSLVGQRVAVDLHDTDPDRAATVWAAINAVHDGLGGGIELAGGVWALLLGWAGLRTGALGRRLSILAVVIGVAGLLTVVPVLEAAGAVFGLGFIVWFVAVGVALGRSDEVPAVDAG